MCKSFTREGNPLFPLASTSELPASPISYNYKLYSTMYIFSVYFYHYHPNPRYHHPVLVFPTNDLLGPLLANLQTIPYTAARESLKCKPDHGTLLNFLNNYQLYLQLNLNSLPWVSKYAWFSAYLFNFIPSISSPNSLYCINKDLLYFVQQNTFFPSSWLCTCCILCQGCLIWKKKEKTKEERKERK